MTDAKAFVAEDYLNPMMIPLLYLAFALLEALKGNFWMSGLLGLVILGLLIYKLREPFYNLHNNQLYYPFYTGVYLLFCLISVLKNQSVLLLLLFIFTFILILITYFIKPCWLRNSIWS